MSNIPEKFKLNDFIIQSIKQQRTKIGMTTIELSNKLGRSRDYISQLEHGRVKFLTKEIAIKLFSMIYGVDNNKAQDLIALILFK
jgi:transcriptional regulator with XRE-family HTH domain